MSEPKFTKGPWKAEKGRYGWQISAAWPGVELNHWIANIKCESCPAHEVANAHLIAAAPALYAALEKSARVWENAIELGLIPPQHIASASILRDDARRALSLARGEKSDG